jgi:hypothetical protein
LKQTTNRFRIRNQCISCKLEAGNGAPRRIFIPGTTCVRNDDRYITLVRAMAQGRLNMRNLCAPETNT